MAQESEIKIAASAASTTGFGEFFRYHGWLSPGVRWFRRIGFPAKAMWVAVVLSIPMVTLGLFLVRSSLEQINIADSERRGVKYVNAVLDVLPLAVDRSRAALAGNPDLADLQARVKQAVQRVAEVDRLDGPSMATSAMFQKLARMDDELQRSARLEAGERTVAAHTDFALAAVTMLRAIADGSQLALDPDLDTYHLMNMAVLRAPRQFVNFGLLSAVAEQALKTGERPQWVHDRMVRSLSVLAMLDEEVGNSFLAVKSVVPELDRTIDMATTNTATSAFEKALRAHFFDTEGKGDVQELSALGQAARTAQFQMTRRSLALLDERLAARSARLRWQLATSLLISAFSLLAAAYLMLAFYKVMMGGLKEVSGHLRQIAQGNLTTAPRPWGKDEAAQLMLDLREMQVFLRQVVAGVRESSEEIVHASGEIAAGAMDLSRRTEQTAANLQQSSATMEEIGSTVRTTADNTQEASNVAQRNVEIAAAGGKAIRDVAATMDGIRAASTRIAEITGAIDAIAFQTNILALNAAVEAARAGETGRGFAVVASEVRTLAQRSATAAREIKSLISSSVEQVEAGTAVVRRASETIEAIVGTSEHAHTLLREVSTATAEQSRGVLEVGRAVSELDHATQQNAALVEQTAAAAASMASNAKALAELVGHFSIIESQGTPGLMHATVVDENFDFDAAIEAHRQWKVKLRQAIAKHEQLDADTICLDDRCTLGKWLHGVGGKRWGTKPDFVNLVESHAKFHRTAAEVARTINAGRMDTAEQLIGAGSPFSEISTEVVMMLTQARRGF